MTNNSGASESAVRAAIAKAEEAEWQGRIAAALDLASEALRQAEALGDPCVEAAALVRRARALDCRQTADARREAEGCYQQALAIARAGHCDELVASILGRIAMLALRLESRLQVVDGCRKAHAEHVDGSARCDVERPMQHFLLGELHHRQGRYDAAEAEQRHAVALARAAGEKDPELHRYLGALANALAAQGKLVDAVERYDEALRNARQRLEAGHPDVIELQMNHGLALMKQGHHKAALSRFKLAASHLDQAGLAVSLDAGILQTFLSDLAYLKGDAAAALDHGRAALQIYLQIKAPAHRHAEAYTCIANAELKARHFEAAVALYERALGLRSELGDHVQRGVNQGSIAEALLGLGQYDDARIHVDAALQILAPPGAAGARDRAVVDWIRALDARVKAGPSRSGPRADMRYFKWLAPVSTLLLALWYVVRRMF